MTDPRFENSISRRRPIDFAGRKCCPLRARFILQCIRGLSEGLAAHGVELQVCRGFPEEVFGALPLGSTVVCQQEPVSPECTDVAGGVAAALARRGGTLVRE